MVAVNPFISIHGKMFGLGPGGPLYQGRPVYNDETGITNTWYVSSAINGLDGRSPQTALGTIVAATAKASAGDKIVVLEGHAETISAATVLTAVAGVRIIGLGQGARRPTITFSTANTATYSCAVNDVSITNILFVANFLSIAAPITLTTALNFAVNNCEFRDTSGVLNFLNLVKSTGAANTVDGLTFNDNLWRSLGTTSVNTAILTANDVGRLTALRNVLKYATTVDQAALIVVTAGVLTDLDCGYNKAYRANTTTANGSLINVGGTTSTGFVYNNYVQTLTTTSDKLFTTTVGLAAFENRVTGVVGATGFVIPAADS